ncbi:MAG: hypothetical protein ACK4NC_06130 [Candidatus Gracilibacteria bacterium]
MSDLDNFVPSESSEGSATGKEASRESSEQFSEQFRQAQARLAGMKKDEKKSKKRDKNLAALLSQFIKENSDPQIVNTLVALLKEEVSSEFLLGIISLYYPNIRTALYEEEQETLMDNPRLIMETRQLTLTVRPTQALVEAKDFDENNLPENIKQAINVWVQDMLFTAFLHPNWLLPKIFKANQVHSTVIQLGTFIVERFLAAHNIKGDFQRKRQFVLYILNGILSETQKRAESHKLAY